MVFVGALLVCGAVISVCAALRLKLQAARQYSWPQVTGRVVRSAIQLGRVFTPDVEYTFEFRNRVFKGTKIRSFFVGLGWPGPARRIAQRYPAGAFVVVFVDTADPKNSVLEPGGDRAFFPIILIVAALVLAAGMKFILQS